MKATNIYSNGQAVSLAMKIQKLQGYGVPFEVSITNGIDGEKVVALSWDEKVLEKAINEEEEF